MSPTIRVASSRASRSTVPAAPLIAMPAMKPPELLMAGGDVTNNSGGFIAGIAINGAAGTVDNSGIIADTGNAVALTAGGSLTNNSGGVIHASSYGVVIGGA